MQTAKFCRIFFTLQHLIDVVLVVLHPPVVTQVGAEHLLRHTILCHIYHGVSILSLEDSNN